MIKDLNTRFAVMEVVVEACLEARWLSGVGLEEYGASEMAALTGGEIKRDIYLGDLETSHVWLGGEDSEPRWLVESNQNMTLRFLGFEYGLAPRNWKFKFWWSNQTDALVGEFWHRVE